MKIRRDFVTNSSSSCFIVSTKSMYNTVSEVKEFLQETLNDYNKAYNCNLILDDFCTVTNTKSTGVIDELFREQCWGGDECCYCNSNNVSWEDDFTHENCPYKTNECKTYTQLVQEGKMAIFCDENSMPYELFDIIESVLDAVRYHLG